MLDAVQSIGHVCSSQIFPLRKRVVELAMFGVVMTQVVPDPIVLAVVKDELAQRDVLK